MRNLEIPRGRSYIGKLILIGLFLCVGNMAFAQDKQDKQEQIEQKSPLSGAHMFKAYCAACHGKDARGAVIVSVTKTRNDRLRRSMSAPWSTKKVNRQATFRRGGQSSRIPPCRVTIDVS